MSGTRPKGLGPDRPQQRTQSSTKPDLMPGDTEIPPPLTGTPLLEGRVPKFLLLGCSIIIGIMFIIAFSLCLAKGVENKQPRYFLLLINIILSTGVTGLLIFWYYRRILQPALLWYVFVQCLFLFFQCVTTDIFAWYEKPSSGHNSPVTTPWSLLNNSTNTTPPNTTHSYAQWPIS